MSVFRIASLKIRLTCRLAACLIVLVSGLSTGSFVYGQGLRAMFEAYKEDQKLNEIKNGGASNGRSQSSEPSDYVIIPPTTGNRQPGHNVQVFPAPPVHQVPPQNANTTQTTDWSNVTLRAAQQSPQAAVDEAVVRKALLGERQNDARLHDVCFATPQLGWAVGDCGVIWHTQNGGQNWHIQQSGTDAPLFAVDFIDPLNGFAVGGTTEPYSHRGLGVVLQTSNGGQSWERLSTFAFPILYCVRIDTPGNAWVAGSASETCPTGILRTSDNGQSWQLLPGAKNEGWTSLGFINSNVGAGIGLNGAIQVVRDKPALSRTPPLGLRRANAVDVFNPRPIAMQNANAAQMPMQAISPYSGWLVGDGGVVMCSRNTGMTWEVPQGFLPVNRPDLFDFQTVFARETNIWVAGNPGTLIFCSNDCGVTWHAAPTGIATPIRKVRFISPERGFAVGDLGAILATVDGGRSWQVQRAGGTRLAVLGIFGRVQDVPYEALSQVCLEEGYLGGVDVVFRQDSMRNDGSEIPAMKRLHEALVNCGGTSSSQPWAFSLDHDELSGNVERVLERLEFENDGHGLARLRENLVTTIRTWRPNVILTSGNTNPSQADETNSEINDPVRDLLQRELLWAVQAAADPMMYPEQLTETGLQTWQVDKVHLCCNATVLQQGEHAGQLRREASNNCNILIRTQTLAPRYGQTFGDMAQAALALFDTKPESPVLTVPFRTVFDIAALQRNCSPIDLNRGGSLLNAISLPPGCEARRTMQGLSMIPHYEKLQQQVAHRNTTRGVISALGQGQGQLADGNRIISQVDNLTQRLGENAAVQSLLEMGNRLHRTGDWDAAAEIYVRIMGMAPTHVSAKTAYAWLLQYMSSFDKGERIGQRETASDLINVKFDTSDFEMTEDLGVRLAGSDGNKKLVNWATGENKSLNQYEKNRVLTDYVGKVAPDVLNDPYVRFCLAASQIRNGEPQLAEGYYIKRSLPPNDDLWAVRAASELWAFGNSVQGNIQGQDRSGRHLPTISCRFTAERPFLDGKLDDEIWSLCQPVVFSKSNESTGANSTLENKPGSTSSDAQAEATASRIHREQTDARTQAFGTEAMFLYDKEFLYLALRCRKTDGFVYRYRDFREIPRTHDPNLVREDRIELLLDQKRNYTTYDMFELDYRGWISESRWQDQNWNPRWFVARHEDETHWYIEAAIPLDQLSNKKPQAGALWGVALRRLVPGVGVEAWNAKNSFNTREGFGYLVFE